MKSSLRVIRRSHDRISKGFQDVYRRFGVKLNTHIGKDMMHCWGAMEYVPEARAVRQEYFKALR